MAFSLRNVFKPRSSKQSETRGARKKRVVNKKDELDSGTTEDQEELIDDESDSEEIVEILDEVETRANLDVSVSSPPAQEVLTEAIERVGRQVDSGSDSVRRTVRDASSEQNSIVQSIYRLVEERTMTRADLNQKRRKVWESLSGSLSEIQDKLLKLDDAVQTSSSAAPSLDGVEKLVAEIRDEGKLSAERVEGALSELRDSQWKRVEEMLSELRSAEKERVDQVISALKEEGEKRISDVAKASDVRVFDAIRSGDERVSTQKEILRGKLDDLGGVYEHKAAALESDYLREIESLRRQKEQAEYRHIDSLKHRKGMLLQMIAVADSLETRIREAQQRVKMREYARDQAQQENGSDETDEQKVSFMRRLIGKKKEDDRLAVEREGLESRVQSMEDEILESFREKSKSLEDLLGLMLMTLKQEGVEPFSALGEPFQPERHVRVEDIPAESGQQPGTVVGMRRRGYMASGELLRPAEVYIAVSPTS
jgi:hypothetical protein